MKRKSLMLLLVLCTVGSLYAENESETIQTPDTAPTSVNAKTVKKVYANPFISGYRDDKKTQPNYCKTKEEIFTQLQKNGLVDPAGKFQNITYQYSQGGTSTLTVTGTPEQIQNLDQAIQKTFKGASLPAKAAEEEKKAEKQESKTEKKQVKAEKKKTSQKTSKSSKTKVKAKKK